MMKFVSYNPAGFVLSVDALRNGTPIQLKFPAGVPVTVQDKYVPRCMKYPPSLLSQYDEASHQDFLDKMEELPGEETSNVVSGQGIANRPARKVVGPDAVDGSDDVKPVVPNKTTGTSLNHLNLDPQTKTAIQEHFLDVEALSAFVDGGGDLTTLAGIGKSFSEKTEQALIDLMQTMS